MPDRPDLLVESLTGLLTPERLGPYMGAVDGDVQRALDLYEWNARISSAVFEDLGYLEVVLRNACDRQLHDWSQREAPDEPWYLSSVLAPASRSDVEKARERSARGHREELPGRVVAELMFGFWRFLHAKRYEATLWTPCLRLAYPHQQPRRRGDVYSRLDHLNVLRNRIAHHEPIHRAQIAGTGKDIAGLHAELIELLRWVDPVIADWVSGRSNVPALLDSRPR